MSRRLLSKCLRRPVSTRLNLDQFEQRIVPASFVVKTTADAGPDSLRAAIGFLNSMPVGTATTVTFDFPPGGPLLFTPTSPLPSMLRKATFSIPFPSDESKRVEINGALAGPGATGLVFTAGGYMADISVTGWSGFGVSITGPPTTITDCYIGTNQGGTVDKGNIGGGIEIKSGGNTIFLTTISGNESHGVTLKGAGAGGNTVFGNLIGVAGDGITVMENKGDGIYCEDAPGNLLGGSIGFGNTVSGNSGTGIHIKGAGAMDNKIVGSKIGLGADNSAVPNAFGGIFIEGAPSTTIGGADPSDKNFISSNSLHGVGIVGATAKGNLLRGNFIGVGLDGTSDRGNKGYGVFIGGGASENFIGKPMPDHGNTIAFNGVDLLFKGHGVVIDSGSKNMISRNSIFKNHGRAIDLRKVPGTDDGVTLNDTYATIASKDGDPDAGANDLQDFPVVVHRAKAAAHMGIHTWLLSSKPGLTYRFEFFENAVLDESGYGEGKTFISDATATANAEGYATVKFDHAGKTLVSATVTDPGGNTSEFSMIDTDADGLADIWEDNDGIDLNQNGVFDAFELILPGSAADKKDLYLEIDSMVDGMAKSYLPSAQARADVIAAFAAAPNDLVHNPSGAAGVTLHLVGFEEDVAEEDFALGQHWVRFDAIKLAKFGSPAQRGDPNWALIKSGLQITHRYALSAKSCATKIVEGKENRGSSGVAELGGNDFMITLRNTIGDDDMAGTLMHEFGHTLGLGHGGGDALNYKPNYRSIMNYSWQFKDILHRFNVPGVDDYSASWKLDYSREKLAVVLDEATLNETTLLGGTAGKMIPYGTADAKGKFLAGKLGDEAGAFNWDRDGTPGENPVSVDINFNGKSNDVLVGHEDWSVLSNTFTENRQSADGAHEEEEEDEFFVPSAPQVQSVVINDGNVQRSRVTKVTVTFDQYVDLPVQPATAFKLIRQNDNAEVELTAAISEPGSTVVTLTFLGMNAVNGSLTDGRYTLTVLNGSVSGFNGLLDGDGNGVGGDDYKLASDPYPMQATNIFCLFGDGDGNGAVTSNDFALFRQSFGTGSNLAFDSNNNGTIDSDDFSEFRKRFGISVVP